MPKKDAAKAMKESFRKSTGVWDKIKTGFKDAYESMTSDPMRESLKKAGKKAMAAKDKGTP